MANESFDVNQLEYLKQMIGTWKGRGFSQIQLPEDGKTQASRDRLNAQNAYLKSTTPAHRSKFNTTQETLTFSAVDHPFSRIGSGDEQSPLFALRYLQDIVDPDPRLNDPLFKDHLHHEPGYWLYAPGAGSIRLPADLDGRTPNKTKPGFSMRNGHVVRQAMIPHGNALVAIGNIAGFTGAPDFSALSTQPSDPNNGANVPVSGDQLKLLDRYAVEVLETNSFPAEMTTAEKIELAGNPAKLLEHDLARLKLGGDTVVSTLQIHMVAASTGISNIPHLQRNANVQANRGTARFSATFFLESIQTKEGHQRLQLQYSQTLFLDFTGFSWPHHTVGTLIRQ